MEKDKKEFESVIKDIINKNEFRELDSEYHHGISRYGHCYRVSYVVFRVCKKLNWHYVDATRAALLHDYYFDYQLEENGALKNLNIHPNVALLNASKDFDLNDRQKNMIASHMFPLGNTLPKYKESFCLTIVDKAVAVYEQRKYKLGMKLGVYLLFIINMITIQK